MSMKETFKCPNCDNVCEVKISTGHNKPENKGKKYINCPNCPEDKKFNWVPGMATNTQIKETENGYEEEARGKVRHGVSIAVIEKIGGKPTPEVKEQINEWVEFIMTGK